MKKAIASMLVILASVAAKAESLATCTVTSWDKRVLASVDIKKWEGPDGFGTHMQHIYQIEDRYYSWGAPFNNDLSEAMLSVGHPSGGGIAFDYHILADLNGTSIKLSDMQKGIQIVCKK